MSFLAGLGNVFHSIGNLFGGDDDEEKKRQQQQQQQQSSAPAFNLLRAPGQNNSQNDSPAAGAPLPPQKLNLLSDEPFQPNLLQKANQPQSISPPPPAQPQQLLKAQPDSSPVSGLKSALTNNAVVSPILNLDKNLVGPALEQGSRLVSKAGGLVKKIPVVGGVVNDALQSLTQTGADAGQAAQGENPFQGLNGNQRTGRAAEDAINIATLGEGSLVKATGENVLKKVAEKTGSDLLGKIAGGAATGHLAAVPVGAGYGAAQTLENNDTNPGDLVKNTAIGGASAGAVGLGVGASIPLAGAGASLVKAGVSRVIGKFAKTPDELAVGIKSANPEPTPIQPSPHVVDTRPAEPAAITPIDEATHAKASQQLFQEYDTATKQAENMPPIPRKQFLDNLDEQTRVKLESLDSALAAGKTQPVDTLTPRAPEPAPVTPEPVTLPAAPVEPAPVAAPAAPAPTPAAAAQAVAEGKPVIQTVDANGNPALVSDATAAKQAEAAGVSPNQVPVAPRTREAAMKQLGDMAKQIPGDGKFRDVTNLDDLADSARGSIENVPPDELVRVFSGNASDLPRDAKGFAMLRAARDRLSQMAKQDPGNGDIKAAIGNVIDEMASRSSEGGLLQRVVQEEFDAMPIEAKVSYLAKKIDQANQHVEGYEPLRSRPEVAAEIDAGLTARLRASEDVAGQVAALGDQLDRAAEAATRGEKVDVKALAKEMQAKQEELLAKNGEVVKYFQSLVPGRSGAQKTLVDFPKRMMLASFTGRVNDIVTTASNVGEQQARNIVQGALAKAYNLVKGPGAVTDTSRGLTKVTSGVFQGLQRFKGEAQGKQYVGDLQKAVKGNEDLRSNLRQPSGPIGRTVQAAVELATHASRGVRNQRLYQLADQEAAKAGLGGSMRRQYAAARSANPSRQMVQNAEQIHLTVNNLNDNPISRTLYKVGQALEGDNKFGRTGIGGVIKNQIIPFTSWLGGNIWNQVTDRNVVAHTLKFVQAVAKGDPEKAVQNAAGAITDAAVAYGVGYQLANMGALTDKNAEGYNDGGLYLHVGGRYISIGVLGFFAPNIVLGKAAYDGIHPPEGKSAAGAMVDTIGGYAWNGLALGSALGVENTLSRAYQSATRPGGSPADAAATAGASTAGQFIPGITGDINAVVDQTNANPTHEAPDTRVQSDKLLKSGKQSQAKDVVKSSIAQLENRIPGLSQTLPRKADVAAKDLFDRVVKGDRDTTGGVKAAQDKQAAVDLSKYDKANSIPDPKGQYDSSKGESFDGAVNARIANNEYDKAITGLTQKLDAYRGDPNTDPKTVHGLENHIKELNVTKGYGQQGQNVRKQYLETTLTEWRDMGDPNSDTYDPDAYQKLYEYDTALAKQGVAGDSTDKTKNKFFAKDKSGAASRRSAARNAADLVKSNTISNLPELKSVSFGNLAPAKINVPIPKIGVLKPEELIKKRAISVSSVR